MATPSWPGPGMRGRSPFDACARRNPFRLVVPSLVVLTPKVLRRLTPLFLAGLLAGSIRSVGKGPHGAVATVLPLGPCARAAGGGLARSTRPDTSRVPGAPFFLCLADAGAPTGRVHVGRGKKSEVWQPRLRNTIA